MIKKELEPILIEKELEDILKIAGTKKFDAQLDRLCEKYKDDPHFKEQVAVFLKTKIAASAKNIEKIENEINLKEQLAEVSQIVSLSYIAKNYFGKTRNWLYQRINGNIVNGKKSKFTGDELQQFEKALKDISKKLSSLSIG